MDSLFMEYMSDMAKNDEGKVYVVSTCDEWKIAKAQVPYWVGTNFAKMCNAIRKAIAGGIMGYAIKKQESYYDQSVCFSLDLLQSYSHEERMRIVGNVTGCIVDIYDNNELTK